MFLTKNLLNVCLKKNCFINLQNRSKLKTLLRDKRIIFVFLRNNEFISSFIFYY
jgi:hypothetical protein